MTISTLKNLTNPSSLMFKDDEYEVAWEGNWSTEYPVAIPFSPAEVTCLMDHYSIPTMEEFQKIANFCGHNATSQGMRFACDAYLRYNINDAYKSIRKQLNFFEFASFLRQHPRPDGVIELLFFNEVAEGHKTCYFFDTDELKFLASTLNLVNNTPNGDQRNET